MGAPARGNHFRMWVVAVMPLVVLLLPIGLQLLERHLLDAEPDRFAPAPVTSAPVTSAPVTSAPVAPAPVAPPGRQPRARSGYRPGTLAT